MKSLTFRNLQHTLRVVPFKNVVSLIVKHKTSGSEACYILTERQAEALDCLLTDWLLTNPED